MPDVSLTLVPGDTMYGSARHYLSVGSNALGHIRQALNVAGSNMAAVTSVLDYACGFGRVLRWLRAGFPTADLYGVDADGPSVAGARALNLGATIIQADISLREDMPRKFDLIWVGSLFTHLSEFETRRVLAYLQDQLSENGIIVFTYHGEYVLNLLTSPKTPYGLDDAGREKVLREYGERGYGYAIYKEWTADYGTSATHPSKMTQICLDADLIPIINKPRAWDNHQDLIACRKQLPLARRFQPREIPG
ncbi:class I SAM-dependent methyltransferase [Sphingobium sp. YR768]|uniref:class I SAM-dependent methyltransferase n=1 Tax=Sphingobium sp. YR768 TaxID=1884365 RepID=UPI0015A5A39C|nr:class I SAM-dependent methyltransferase [Sphingobium sp. YR768]